MNAPVTPDHPPLTLSWLSAFHRGVNQLDDSCAVIGGERNSRIRSVSRQNRPAANRTLPPVPASKYSLQSEYSSQKFLCEPLAGLIAAAPRWRVVPLPPAFSSVMSRAIPEMPTVRPVEFLIGEIVRDTLILFSRFGNTNRFKMLDAIPRFQRFKNLVLLIR